MKSFHPIQETICYSNSNSTNKSDCVKQIRVGGVKTNKSIQWVMANKEWGDKKVYNKDKRQPRSTLLHDIIQSLYKGWQIRHQLTGTLKATCFSLTDNEEHLSLSSMCKSPSKQLLFVWRCLVLFPAINGKGLYNDIISQHRRLRGDLHVTQAEPTGPWCLLHTLSKPAVDEWLPTKCSTTPILVQIHPSPQTTHTHTNTFEHIDTTIRSWKYAPHPPTITPLTGLVT